MKKMKLFLLAAVIVAAGSAFTTVKPVDDLWVLAEDGVTFITKDEGINRGGICQPFPDEKCEYTAPNASSPNTAGPSGRYAY